MRYTLCCRAPPTQHSQLNSRLRFPSFFIELIAVRHETISFVFVWKTVTKLTYVLEEGNYWPHLYLQQQSSNNDYRLKWQSSKRAHSTNISIVLQHHQTWASYWLASERFVISEQYYASDQLNLLNGTIHCYSMWVWHWVPDVVEPVCTINVYLPETVQWIRFNDEAFTKLCVQINIKHLSPTTIN